MPNNSDPLTAEELAELKAKWEAATKGEWKVAPEPHDDWGMIRGGDTGPVASTCMSWRYCDEEAEAARLTETVPREVEANAEAIVALHNAFPRLLATLAAKDAEVAAWEQAVKDELSDCHLGRDAARTFVSASERHAAEKVWSARITGVESIPERQQALSRAVGSGEGTSTNHEGSES